MPRRMMLTALDGVPAVRPGADLAAIVADAMRGTGVTAQDGDVLVIAQKIVSKAEGRAVALREVTPSARANELAAIAGKDPRVVELILGESTEVLRCVPGVIIVEHRLGLVMANAGIDASNVDRPEGDEIVLLLPLDPDRSAADLREALHLRLGRDLGVVIADSFGRAWRNGTVGTAIGLSGPPGLLDMRGLPDRSGRLLQHTEVGIADELAAAASLLMGQADEGLPIVHVSGFPHALRAGSARELQRRREIDLFR